MILNNGEYTIVYPSAGSKPKVMLLAGGAGSVLEYKAAVVTTSHHVCGVGWSRCKLVQVVATSHIGRALSALHWDIYKTSLNKSCSKSLVSPKSPNNHSDLFRSFQIFSDLSVLRTLIFCIIVGLLCGLLGAAFNALNIQVGRPVSPAALVRRVVGRLGAGHGVEIQMVQCIDVWGPRWAGGFGCLIHLPSGNLT